MSKIGKKLLDAVGDSPDHTVLSIIDMADVSDINYVANDWTPLILAIHKGRTSIAKLLIEKGADVTLKSGDGWSPIYTAIRRDDTEILREILKHDASLLSSKIDPNEKNTAIEYAYNESSTGALLVLLDAGCEGLSYSQLRNVYKNALKEDIDANMLQTLKSKIEWELINQEEIKYLEGVKANFSISRIYNFRAMNVITIVEKSDSNSMSHEEKSFSDPAVDIETLKKAKEELLARGGKLDETKFRRVTATKNNYYHSHGVRRTIR